MWAGKTARGWGRGWELSLSLSSSFLGIVSRSLISGHTPHDLNAGNRLEAAWCNGIRIPESKNVLPVGSRIWENLLLNPKSWALESGIQLKESGIPPTIAIQNPTTVPLTKTEIHHQEIRNPRSGIQNPRLSWIPLHGVYVVMNCEQPRNCMQWTFWDYRWINMHICQTRNSLNYK